MRQGLDAIAAADRANGRRDRRAHIAHIELVDPADHARFASLQAEGIGITVVDAISNEDLLRIGKALAGMPLVTAGSGMRAGANDTSRMWWRCWFSIAP